MSSLEPTNLLGLGPEQLVELVAQWGGKPFRARQLQRWIHQRQQDDFGQMTDLAREFREQLTANCVVTAPSMSHEHISTDGTRKWLFDVGSNNAVEAVFHSRGRPGHPVYFQPGWLHGGLSILFHGLSRLQPQPDDL